MIQEPVFSLRITLRDAWTRMEKGQKNPWCLASLAWLTRTSLMVTFELEYYIPFGIDAPSDATLLGS
jgi:hypothetical protein